MVSFIKTSDSLQCFGNGQSVSVPLNHPRLREIKQCIKDDNIDKIFEIVDVQNSINNQLKNSSEETVKDVKVSNGEVLYRGEVMHNALSDRILELHYEGYPIEPWCRFLSKLMKNPSFNSREQLFTFSESNSLPLAKDGDLLAYKGVTDDYLDCHTKSVDNSVGAKPPRMNREDVDDNVNNACSKGYHAGSLNYASDFGQRVVIVKFSPEDAVCVPHDSVEKLRMCAYEVVEDYKGELKNPLYNDDSSDYDDYDDYDDFDSFDDLFPGDKITFRYDDMNRVAWVQTVDEQPVIQVKLDSSDVKFDTLSSNFRNFAKDKIEELCIV